MPFVLVKTIQVRLKEFLHFRTGVCISVNNEVIHGIPSKLVILKEGDIVSTDLTVYKDGFHADASRTYIVGGKCAVCPEISKLVDIAKQAFFEGIQFAKVGYRIGDISNAIGSFVQKNGFSVIEEFQGHGIGRNMHEEPGVPNDGVSGKGARLSAGMCLAIEPMISMGLGAVEILDDGWTVVTKDDSLASHYENTILITEKEPEILTMF